VLECYQWGPCPRWSCVLGSWRCWSNPQGQDQSSQSPFLASGLTSADVSGRFSVTQKQEFSVWCQFEHFVKPSHWTIKEILPKQKIGEASNM